MVVMPWLSEPRIQNHEEALLLPPLLDLLRATGRVRESTLVVSEFPWNGRRVDLATLSVTRTTSAYELKLASFQRALEQAMYNRLSFDRSWIVTRGLPKQTGLLQAAENGIGVMTLDGASMRILVLARPQQRSRTVRARLVAKLQAERSKSV
ncbi:hypothetical protein GCM10025870_11210 [Agromyces marinus]|uniref:Uncharacterized protein n=1 Tax=Agromyces marinus TaxID=1389020 RepID=A0ABM8GZZ3_9MICO|nr:hypothetical protein GCM10025870_11210 [Agromyces marinus]